MPLPPIPTLQTQRLVLRPIAQRDAASVQRLFARWEVTRWMPAGIPWPYPDDGAATNLTECMAEIASRAKFHWAITLKGSDTLRGRIGLRPFDGQTRDMRGFWLDPELQGRGLITEAAEAVTGYAFEALEWPVLYFSNASSNLASARIKEKQGAVEIDRAPKAYVFGPGEEQVWLLRRDVWLARSGRPKWSYLSDQEWFQLRRQSDDLVYTFRRRRHPTAGTAYQRQDQDYWITFRPGLGWVAWDDATQSCIGRPWEVQTHDQGDCPPEGTWVSRKGPKTYVYELVYIDPPPKQDLAAIRGDRGSLGCGDRLHGNEGRARYG